MGVTHRPRSLTGSRVSSFSPLLQLQGHSSSVLEGVEDPQDLLGVTADGAGGHHGELDLAVGVDDEDRALREAVPRPSTPASRA